MTCAIRSREKSREIFESSCVVIPGGVNSPVRSFSHFDMDPLVVKKGKGDLIWDVDGHEYIDFCGSWGALILGHADDEVLEAIIEQMKEGTSFGAITEVEKLLAEKIISHMPSIEKMRFVSSGTEATMSALRLARGYTGKNRIVKFNGNYHGHSDCLLIRAGSGVTLINQEASSKGVPLEMIKHTVSLTYNDLEGVRHFLRSQEDIAAVIIEPIAGNMGLIPARKEFLQMLKQETEKKGILLIFDEVISGFRVGLEGVQGIQGIDPDLTCLGKVIGGGFPAAAFGGKREIMDHLAPNGQVYQAGTLSGNPVAMRAGLCTLKRIEQKDFYSELEEKTSFLLSPIQCVLEEKEIPACVQQSGSCFSFFWGIKKANCQEDLKNLDVKCFTDFFQYLFERGIYFSPSAYETCFISAAHTYEHLKYTQTQILEFINQL